MRYAPLLVLVAALLPADLAAQVSPPMRASISSEMDAGVLTQLAVGATVHTPLWLDGEAMEGLTRGIGSAATVHAVFDPTYSARFDLGFMSFGDLLGSSRATAIDAVLALGWTRELGRGQLEVGPVVGLSWLTREIYQNRVFGFVAGLELGAQRGLSRAIEIAGRLEGRWTSYGRPTFETPTPTDPDGGADATQIRISVSLAWRLRQGPETPN